MRIECPNCAAVYEVPQTQLQAVRGLRCARCDLQWRPPGLVAEPPAVAVVRAASTLLRQSAIRVVPPPVAAEPVTSRIAPPFIAPHFWRSPTWSAGWAASVILLLGLLGASAHWRTAIMHGWPPSMRLYAALGAPPP